MIMKFVLRKNRLFEEYTMAHIKDTPTGKKSLEETTPIQRNKTVLIFTKKGLAINLHKGALNLATSQTFSLDLSTCLNIPLFLSIQNLH